ncbi:uncharacterized protein PGTG_22415 [Puccinia graminis f. sp. tritici CRL 75-36-700-3]|uniref:Uncharacterized protein n=1 Tax=Puccinia graminis f. sp. tritici (strain CRL 75-36-700-3 / race SCCL) TaxID=418459 RepID=H6QUI0_PUCGT|nr:uncharacterized protein PGTG_22415 [Puccinia graminis f. sp. tritici CRL 75-36-700-3]EHS64692.1 hypothetical protein PGTG_22415 [Puccinia graminis f. sp. tritici CRL 75-36-700-3]
MDSTDYNPSANAKELKDSTWRDRSSLIDRLSSPIASTLPNKKLPSEPIDKPASTEVSSNQNIKQHLETNRGKKNFPVHRKETKTNQEPSLEKKRPTLFSYEL